MKKLVLGALCIVLGFAANAAAGERIDGIDYCFDTTKLTALIDGYDHENPPTKIDRQDVLFGGQPWHITSSEIEALRDRTSLTTVSLPQVVSVGIGAFYGCSSLTSVSLPRVETIGQYAFSECSSLSMVYVNETMKGVLEANRSYYGIRSEARIISDVSKEAVEQAEFLVKVGDEYWTEADYALFCKIAEVTPKRDSQLFSSNTVVVSKETIQAAKAETISFADGAVQLGVSVLSNANFTAETESWGKVKFDENTKVSTSEDKTQLIISIPVADKQGFMILQSGEGKIGSSDEGEPSDPGTSIGPDLPSEDPDKGASPHILNPI